jgi:transcriptional regulator with GAF, ATPase, and Fis domain
MTHYEETTLLPSHLGKELTATNLPTLDMELSAENDLSVLMEGYERKVIEEVLKKNNWNQTAAARSLNISEAVIRYKIKRLQLKKPDFTKNS